MENKPIKNAPGQAEYNCRQCHRCHCGECSQELTFTASGEPLSLNTAQDTIRIEDGIIDSLIEDRDIWKSRAQAHEENYLQMLRRIDVIAKERDLYKSILEVIESTRTLPGDEHRDTLDSIRVRVKLHLDRFREEA